MAKKAETTESKKDKGVSLSLRMEAFFLKLKKAVDGLVDAYCRLARIGPLEARDIISRKAASLMRRGQRSM